VQSFDWLPLQVEKKKLATKVEQQNNDEQDHVNF